LPAGSSRQAQVIQFFEKILKRLMYVQ